MNASYTLSKSTSDIGSAYDELAQNIVQDIRDPFGPVQDGPSTRTDARHRFTISAIVEAPWDLRVAPIFFYRSALPVHTFEGIDLNADSIANDRTARAYRFTGVNDDDADVRGDGRLRDRELQPAGGVLAAQRPRQPGVPAVA
jgi:hypothetical protein